MNVTIVQAKHQPRQLDLGASQMTYMVRTGFDDEKNEKLLKIHNVKFVLKENDA